MLWLLLLIPLFRLAYQIALEINLPGSGLGADPGKEIVSHLGEWSIRILYLTLAVSSLSRIFKVPGLIFHRRLCGLFAFSYVVIHFMSYILFVSSLSLSSMADDIAQRPYILVGFLAYLSLIPLAVTSTHGWRRRLGLNWKRLHRLIYVAAALAWIHLFWLEKASFEESAIYGIILVVLFGERIYDRWQRQRKRLQAQ